MTTSLTPLNIYRLRIVLRGISPLIWRRVQVRSDTTLAHLHAILQGIFCLSGVTSICIAFTFIANSMGVFAQPLEPVH